MAYKAYILLGRITKVHGFEGTVTIKLEKSFFENIPELESVFLEIEGKPVPFFISMSEYPGADILRLRFDGYESIEKASEFVGSRIYLTTGEEAIIINDDLRDLCGFKVHLPDKSLVGTIIEVIENPGQWLLNIKTDTGKEILIPLHEHFIVKVDNKKKIITMDLPDGLIEIN
ncbi:MAG: ribosome maturation factor RimM [Bacteroidales bacterium]|nr:ribosome maturation factor RimM [Bacteroidales bacterium]